MSKTHTANLNRGACRLLAQMLIAPGWYTDPLVAARACALLELPELDQDSADLKNDTPAMKAWEREPVELVLTEKQRDVVKACIESHTKRGGITCGHQLGRLLAEFGFTPKDD